MGILRTKKAEPASDSDLALEVIRDRAEYWLTKLRDYYRDSEEPSSRYSENRIWTALDELKRSDDR